MFTPTGNNVAIHADPAPKKKEKTDGGVIIPQTARPTNTPIQKGTIVAVGPGLRNALNGELTPVDLSIGDRVAFLGGGPGRSVEENEGEEGGRVFIILSPSAVLGSWGNPARIAEFKKSIEEAWEGRGAPLQLIPPIPTSALIDPVTGKRVTAEDLQRYLNEGGTIIPPALMDDVVAATEASASEVAPEETATDELTCSCCGVGIVDQEVACGDCLGNG